MKCHQQKNSEACNYAGHTKRQVVYIFCYICDLNYFILSSTPSGKCDEI